MNKKEPKKSEIPISEDCTEKLYNKRIIFIDKEITSESASTWISQLIALDLYNSEPIIMLINSSGGEIYSTLAIIDIMDSIKSPVYTMCIGTAFSSAALILVSGYKRFATINSTVMIHQIYTTVEDLRVKDFKNEAFEMNRVHEIFVEKFIQKTKMNREKVELVHDKDSYFNAKQALDVGIVDEIGFKLSGE